MICNKKVKHQQHWVLLFALSISVSPLCSAQNGNTTNTNLIGPVALELDSAVTTHNNTNARLKRKAYSVSRGFRIQIYSGPDREAAKATKVAFMKRFPSIRSYISYEVPDYKIKVGDFRNRAEAVEFNRHLNKTFPTMITPSLINNKTPGKLEKPKPVETIDSTKTNSLD